MKPCGCWLSVFMSLEGKGLLTVLRGQLQIPPVRGVSVHQTEKAVPLRSRTPSFPDLPQEGAVGSTAQQFVLSWTQVGRAPRTGWAQRVPFVLQHIQALSAYSQGPRWGPPPARSSLPTVQVRNDPRSLCSPKVTQILPRFFPWCL